jgi:hypothetical protein
MEIIINMTTDEVLEICKDILDNHIIGDTRLIGLCYIYTTRKYVAELIKPTSISMEFNSRPIVMLDEGYCLTTQLTDNFETKITDIIKGIEGDTIMLIKKSDIQLLLL